MTEPAQTEPAQTEPAQTEPAQTEPATVPAASVDQGQLSDPPELVVPPRDDRSEGDSRSDPETATASDGTASGGTADSLADLATTVGLLVTEAEKHHQRAAHRETVIDDLHAEVERLRTGERRGTVRPLLSAIARIRDNLVRQADELPADFDAARARKLLRSFADSIEIVFEDFGVASYAPSPGDEFDPRRHKAIASEPTDDVARTRTIAGVRREGYLDIEAGVLLTQAEVVVYVAAPTPAHEPAPAPDPSESADAPTSPDSSPSAATPDADAVTALELQPADQSERLERETT